MKLSHYSPVILSSLNLSRPYPDRIRYWKPRGFWVSVDGENDWAEWCVAEEFGIGQHRHVVTLKSDAKIKIIATEDELRRFHKDYGTLKLPVLRERMFPDWEKLATEYQGIIIAPYIWPCRLDMDVDWYYPWDCASGCIWDLTAIESIEHDPSWTIPKQEEEAA